MSLKYSSMGVMTCLTEARANQLFSVLLSYSVNTIKAFHVVMNYVIIQHRHKGGLSHWVTCSPRPTSKCFLLWLHGIFPLGVINADLGNAIRIYCKICIDFRARFYRSYTVCNMPTKFPKAYLSGDTISFKKGMINPFNYIRII